MSYGQDIKGLQDGRQRAMIPDMNTKLSPNMKAVLAMLVVHCGQGKWWTYPAEGNEQRALDALVKRGLVEARLTQGQFTSFHSYRPTDAAKGN